MILSSANGVGRSLPSTSIVGTIPHLADDIRDLFPILIQIECLSEYRQLMMGLIFPADPFQPGSQRRTRPIPCLEWIGSL